MACKIGSREHSITNYVNTKEIGPVPLVDIPMMSDYKWQRKALQSRLEDPEWYRAILGEDVEAVIADLRLWLEEHSEGAAS